jgi:hypothetical protein
MIRSRPCHVVVLLPSMEAVAARERGRKSPGYTCWTLAELYEGFASATPRVGVWLDTDRTLARREPHHLYVVVEGVGRAPTTSGSGTTSDSILSGGGICVAEESARRAIRRGSPRLHGREDRVRDRRSAGGRIQPGTVIAMTATRGSSSLPPCGVPEQAPPGSDCDRLGALTRTVARDSHQTGRAAPTRAWRPGARRGKCRRRRCPPRGATPPACPSAASPAPQAARP